MTSLLNSAWILPTHNATAPTKLAPTAFQTQMVALFVLSVPLGTAAAGALASRYDPAHEVPYFLVLGVAAIALGVVIAALSPLIRRLMHGVH
ncbi:hypothetical protein ACPPVO_23230 [Dactylosporangium sp. McL0621]|uniref:hypothetical protein n=1 Tax=Dactylosporangium sp. McL0621 TaxID=3415678 RepID=UPI003CE6FA6A